MLCGSHSNKKNVKIQKIKKLNKQHSPSSKGTNVVTATTETHSESHAALRHLLWGPSREGSTRTLRSTQRETSAGGLWAGVRNHLPSAHRSHKSRRVICGSHCDPFCFPTAADSDDDDTSTPRNPVRARPLEEERSPSVRAVVAREWCPDVRGREERATTELRRETHVFPPVTSGGQDSAGQLRGALRASKLCISADEAWGCERCLSKPLLSLKSVPAALWTSLQGRYT